MTTLLKKRPPNTAHDEKGEARINFYHYPPLSLVEGGMGNSLKETLGLSGAPAAQTFALFVSVPYCFVRCNSCVFFKERVSPNAVNDVIPKYASLLPIELSLYRNASRFLDANCGAIYFGGGTASLLPATNVAILLEEIRKTFPLPSGVEITLEGNPGDFTKEYLTQIIQAGVNRISLGVQSFNAQTLQAIGSPHTAQESQNVVELASLSSLRTYNVDFLFGVPGQTEADYFGDLADAVRKKIPSIKVYEYVVYPRTKAEQLLRESTLPPQVQKAERHQWYLRTRRMLGAAGYVEGRKGSFALPGHRQVYGHIAYDNAGELIGLGVGAYSFINGIQFANATSVAQYSHMVAEGTFPPAAFVSRKATSFDLMKRYSIFNLFSGRISRSAFVNLFGIDPLTVFATVVSELQGIGLMEVSQEAIFLTDAGFSERREVLTDFYMHSSNIV